MKIRKTASGKRLLKLSKKEWLNIGKKAGWIKKKADRIPLPITNKDDFLSAIHQENEGGSGLTTPPHLWEGLWYKNERYILEKCQKNDWGLLEFGFDYDLAGIEDSGHFYAIIFNKGKKIKGVVDSDGDGFTPL